MSAYRHSTDDRIAASASQYTSTGEHAKIPLMICVASGRTSFQGKVQLMELDARVSHGDSELPVSDHEHVRVAPAADASHSRFFAEEPDPIPVSCEARQPVVHALAGALIVVRVMPMAKS